jgi:mutator protein MutT
LSLAEKPLTHVVAAAVIDAAGRVLVAQRPAGKHLAGGWEFPGGKLEDGEDRRAGLARELREELGISITTPRPLIRVRHSYDYGDVLIDMWVARQYSGEPQGLDGQVLRWCTQDELQAVELLPADGPIVAALRLPERLTEASTRFYSVGPSAEPDSRGRLCGVMCSGAADALASSDAGANFLALQSALPRSEFATICQIVPIPVYVPGLSLQEAWACGASGINDLLIT